MAKPMYVRFEVPKEMIERTYQVVETARDTGKVRKGTNEVTKLIEKKMAKLVVMAEDVQPEEILAHIPLLCEEKGVPFTYVPSKQELGVASGLKKATASAAVIDPGKGADAMKALIADITKLTKGEKKGENSVG